MMEILSPIEVRRMIARSAKALDTAKAPYHVNTQIAMEYIYCGFDFKHYDEIMGIPYGKDKSNFAYWKQACKAIREFRSRRSEIVSRYIEFIWRDR